MPFPLQRFDADSDSVFINETVRDYCASDIAFTRYLQNCGAKVRVASEAV